MIKEVIANPIQQEEIDVISAENVEVVPPSNDTILSVLKCIAALLVFIALMGTLIFYMMY
jgi:hypothetical protein